MSSILRYAEKIIIETGLNLRKVMSETWRLINDVLPDKVSKNKNCTVSEIVMGGKVVSNPLEISTKFNNCFINIGPDRAKKISKSPDIASIIDSMPSSDPNSLFFEQCTVTEVITTTKTLASTSGVGLDGFSSNIKNVIYCRAEPLTHIFNSTFISSGFPDKLKHAKVAQILKNEDNLAITNHRPVSILPVISKILEKLMHNRLMSFLDKHHLISAFRERPLTYNSTAEHYRSNFTRNGQ